MKRRNVVAAMALGASNPLSWAQAAPYPSKPIRVVIGFTPGGAADYVARSMSESLGKAMGISHEARAAKARPFMAYLCSALGVEY